MDDDDDDDDDDAWRNVGGYILIYIEQNLIVSL